MAATGGVDQPEPCKFRQNLGGLTATFRRPQISPCPIATASGSATRPRTEAAALTRLTPDALPLRQTDSGGLCKAVPFDRTVATHVG